MEVSQNKSASGKLFKMEVSHENPIQYKLNLNELISINEFIGKEIQFNWNGEIRCISCDKKTKTSFGQGFCYTCFMSEASASPCILRPELCRAHLGEGRDIEWEEKNHNQPHVVYLAATDVVKVGVTRSTQIPTRWIDQGASSVIILAETPNRYIAGIIEVALKDYFTDKTNWRNMLKNQIDESIDLIEEKWKMEDILPSDLAQYLCENDHIYFFDYPVEQFPKVVKSVSFDKEKVIQGKLLGIKGQYLLLDQDRVLNLRKHTGYIIEVNNPTEQPSSTLF